MSDKSRLVLCVHKDSDVTDTHNYVFMDRSYVDNRYELDLGQMFPQVIPVMLLTDGKGNVLSYARNGTETRLHGSRSVLIGGHIDITDINRAGLEDIIEYAAFRELQEEAGICNPIDNYPKDNIIYTDEDPVSSVHLGLLEVIVVNTEEVTPSDELFDAQWFSSLELEETLNQYEEWSKIAIQRVLPSL